MTTSFDSTPSVSRIAAVLATALLSACATVDFDYPRTESRALSPSQTSTTHLGEKISAVAAQHAKESESGFILQLDGIDALATRLVLADRAEQSIDAQYYLITNDSVGLIFVGALLEAADRGVRVRLLLDDIQTQGYDTGLTALDSHPNFEVRVFNPWAQRGIRGLDLFAYSRLNRRMHNKSFTVDSQVTIVGGRNIAEEYFGARKDVNFGDADVMAVGPVVQAVSGMFDRYWNHERAVPVPGFARPTEDPAADLEALRATIRQVTDDAMGSQYAEAISADIQKYFDNSIEDDFAWAPFEVVYDSPDKAFKEKAAEADSIVTPLAAAVDRAERQVIIISPYFVPQKSGIEYFQTLIDRGLRVIVITNSLAANNHAIVHSGYAPSRKKLLKMGVELYEVKATKTVTGVERGGGGASLATLHTKGFVVDDTEFFLGSFNWDPRSVNINTELGIIMKSTEIGADIVDRVFKSLDEKTYQLTLNDKGELRWVDNEADPPVMLSKEPDTTFWRRLGASLGQLLPVRSQL